MLPFFPTAKKASWTDTPLQAGATTESLIALCDEIQTRGVSAGYAHRLVNRYGLAADQLAVADMGEIFDDTFSEKEIPYLRDHEWAQSAQAMLQRRTKTSLLASPAALPRIHAAIDAALK